MYPIDSSMNPPTPIIRPCPICHDTWLKDSNGDLYACECNAQKKLPSNLSWLPELKEKSGLDRALIRMPSAWLVKAQAMPVNRMCIFDIHLRRFLLDQWKTRSFSEKYLSPQEVLNTAWNEGKLEELLKYDLLSIMMPSWNWYSKSYDGMVGIIQSRTLKNKLTLLVSPKIEMKLTFESKAMTEWYADTMEAKQLIALKWRNDQTWFDEAVIPSFITTPEPPRLAKVVLREEQVSVEQRIQEGIAALRQPLTKKELGPDWGELPDDED